jgi:anti-sigma28 factor (negative regulator of flagellin synthesis)
MKANQTMKRQAAPNHRRRKDKKTESTIDSAVNIPTLKQQKQINDRKHHIPININPDY